MDWNFVIGVVLIALAIAYLAAACVSLRRTGKAVRLAQHRLTYRRGIVAGYAKCERKWVHRRQVELANADRRAEPREDSGPAARIVPIRYHSGK